MIAELSSFIRSYQHGNKHELLIGVAGLEAIFTFGLVISSFVVAGTANAGFNCVLTGFLNVAFIAGSYYVLKKSKAPIAFGFLIGSSGMMTILNFMTAIFWGQLSRCKELSYSVAQYSCSNHAAYASVCAFAVLLFITQLGFTAAVVLWRGELINEGEGGNYDEISGSSNHNPYEAPGGNYPSSAPSADL